jgi:REP element-mobilizing transposase RayT
MPESGGKEIQWGWGGWRPGAGRKPKHGVAGVSHARRPVIKRGAMVHLTLRLKAELVELLSKKALDALQTATMAGGERTGFKLHKQVVKGEQIHLLVEADYDHALSRGAQGLNVRIARAINRVLERSGKVFADRYEAKVLKSAKDFKA